MKLKFLTIKKKTIIAFLLCFLAVGAFCGTYFPIKANTSPKPVHTIVIDAGHGGMMSRKDSIILKIYKKHILDML